MLFLEVLVVCFILWLIYRRVIYPFLDGYRQIRTRFDDLNKEQRGQSHPPHERSWEPKPKKESRIDRSQVKDADFRDLPKD
jgi:hypothetical protein